MRTSIRILIASIVGIFGLAACQTERSLGDAVEDLKSAMPSVCKELCAAKVDCFINLAEDSTRAREKEELVCQASCAHYATDGGYVFVYRPSDTCAEWDEETDECWDYEYVNEYKEHIPGLAIQEYLECLWDADYWTCIYDDIEEESFFGDTRSNDDKEVCNAIASCIKELDSELLEVPKWHGLDPEDPENDETWCGVDDDDNEEDVWTHLELPFVE